MKFEGLERWKRSLQLCANLYNRHEANPDSGPDLPQRIKDSDKKWAKGSEPIGVVIYELFLIKHFQNINNFGFPPRF